MAVLNDHGTKEKHRKQILRHRHAVKGLSAGLGIDTEPRCNCGAEAVLVITSDSGEKYFCAAHFPPKFVPKQSVPQG